ncbi:MAG TPA: NAD(P)-dependent oxidoreductase [Coxiellaceae bacterium]|nr:MAG: NAD(P)-dependent oxidoreductase [Gammaproteobacteria bacterium RBG_16_37_9]HBC71395.1 NAD(P)-dependent oxidoreductase [Coxiellaceae bacterium]HBY55901.1 NAD(P)-dependent oxidoreductase [Coxiellaceae bacterium]
MIMKNKIVLITGASSGIGEACAKVFAKHGAKLLLCARRHDRLEQLADKLIKEYNCTIHTFQLDVRNHDNVKRKITSLPKEWSDIDILINNAGLAAGLDKFQDASFEDWETMIDTNIKGLLYVTRAVLPNMLKRNQGHILNIGSLAGHEVYPLGHVYCATKSGVNALTRGLKMDLVDTNIRVSTVNPGMVETEFSEVRFKGDKERAKKVYSGFTPLTAADIADAVFYCASRSAHVNILEVIITPTAQASATTVHRK